MAPKSMKTEFGEEMMSVKCIFCSIYNDRAELSICGGIFLCFTDISIKMTKAIKYRHDCYRRFPLFKRF